MSDAGLIVVGVDGSEPARVALEFAVDEAVRRGARLRVVTVYEPVEMWPVPYGLPSGVIVPPTAAELREDADRTVRRVVEEVVPRRQGAVQPDVQVVQGHPAQVLVDQAAGADLLVVGHRGLGAFASACLGSVGLQCILHAKCPVTVVRPMAGPAPWEWAERQTASSATGSGAGSA